ncbi:unnamed protein product [Camellia sinensis]
MVKIGLRWRTEKEVVSGKGQFVNFSYFEAGENKQALVKLVTCERCAEKLLYKKMKEKEQLRKREKEELLKKRERSESGDGTDTGYGRSKKRKKERILEAQEEARFSYCVLEICAISRGTVHLSFPALAGQDDHRERVASTSASDHKSKSDDDENFDEFLEGMFP